MRLFTFRSFRRLLEQEGYRIVRMRGVPAPYPKALGDNFLSRILLRLNALAIRIRRGMFAYQIYVEAVCLPPVERLLARTLASTRDRTDPAGERSERAGPAQQ